MKDYLKPWVDVNPIDPVKIREESCIRYEWACIYVKVYRGNDRLSPEELKQLGLGEFYEWCNGDDKMCNQGRHIIASILKKLEAPNPLACGYRVELWKRVFVPGYGFDEKTTVSFTEDYFIKEVRLDPTHKEHKPAFTLIDFFK